MEFRDLNQQYRVNKEQIDSAIQRVLNKGQYIGGEEVEQLENQLAEYVGTKYCISCANGTEAMTLVLMAWGIGKGDAVFVPDFTFFSTGEVVSFLGATPIFVDVYKDTFNIDIEKLEKSIKKVKAEGKLTPKVIIPVDLYGLPANYEKLEPLAIKYNLKLLEDGAQGFGGEINGKKACSFGDAATTSFFPAKPLGCYGDGGAIFTDDKELCLLLNSLKVHGKGSGKYDNVRVGVNSRLDTIQAAILSEKLKLFKNFELEHVNKVYEWYTKGLENIVETPFIPEGYISSFAQYTIKLPNKDTRDGLKNHLDTLNIPTMIYYTKPMHKQKAFSHLDHNEKDIKVTNTLVDRVLSLPMHPYLTKKETFDVIENIKLYFKNEKNEAI